MPNYRRAFVPEGCFFFTVNLLERRRTLLVDHVATLRRGIRARGSAWSGGLRLPPSL
jgi:putative transposase